MIKVIIYAIIITVFAFVFAVKAIKNKIALKATTLFCITYFRKPTEKEIKECSEKTIRNLLRIKE